MEVMYDSPYRFLGIQKKCCSCLCLWDNYNKEQCLTESGFYWRLVLTFCIFVTLPTVRKIISDKLAKLTFFVLHNVRTLHFCFLRSFTAIKLRNRNVSECLRNRWMVGKRRVWSPQIPLGIEMYDKHIL